MALFGGVNVDRSPGTQRGRNVLADAQDATRRTAPIPTAGFTPFQRQAFDIVGQQGVNPAVEAAQGFLPGLAGGSFIGAGPGQSTLQQAAGGGFQNLAIPEAQSALDFSRGFGVPAGLQATAAGENLSAPFLNGEFARLTDPLVDQFRNIQFPALQGQFGASGLRGTARQGFEQEFLQDQANRAVSGVAADLLGRERGFQQQAQLAIPGLEQNILGGQLGAIGQLGGLSANDINRQIGAAGALQDDFGRDVAQAGQAGFGAPGFATGALGSQVNPLLQIGGQQQALQQARNAARDEAIQREVQRAALIGGANPGFTGAVQGQQAGGGLGGAAGGALGGAATGAALGSIFPGIGTGFGALGGGLLGGLGGFFG
ncbi:MAG: hypothetical protein ACR2RF_31345 [Geminicoccaceae bacterium]